ncbi:MAG: hypothetical protein NTY61_02155, partial [Candidatus Parcubacteria bacterium]|nr:hypothetical protein [Candidatus Parcubacteria bacterium]
LKKELLVNQAVLGYEHNYYRIIKEHRPNIICLGYDQKVDIPALKQQLADWKLEVEIHRLASFYPEKYKSSLLNK